MTTDKGVVRARSVVVCTNGWAPELLPELADHLYPCRNQVHLPAHDDASLCLCWPATACPNLLHPACNRMCPTCNCMHPACNRMRTACNSLQHPATMCTQAYVYVPRPRDLTVLSYPHTWLQVVMTAPLPASAAWQVGALSVDSDVGARELYMIRRPDGRLCHSMVKVVGQGGRSRW